MDNANIQVEIHEACKDGQEEPRIQQMSPETYGQKKMKLENEKGTMLKLTQEW